MRIVVTKTRVGLFRADCADLPGSPWCGQAATESEAIADMFIGNLRITCYQLRLMDLASVTTSIEIVREYLAESVIS